jgi:hypothetical protein
MSRFTSALIVLCTFGLSSSAAAQTRAAIPQDLLTTIARNARALRALAAFPQVEAIIAASTVSIPAPMQGTTQATISTAAISAARSTGH